MLPTLSIGPIAIPTYPFSILIAFWVAMSFTARQADQRGLDGDHAYNAGLYGLISGILGARIWFVLSHWENYAPDLSQALSLSRGALSAPEGLIIAGVVMLVYLQRNRVPLGSFVDAAAPGAALALVIINIGAFLGGVNLGAPSTVPWAVDIAGTLRHPIQLYEAAAGLMIFAVLLVMKFDPWSGFKFWSLIILYGVSRLFLEIFRAQPLLIGENLLAVQVFALISIVVALAVMAYHFTHVVEATDLDAK
jgi:phosphatidylglycerol:prolipoprotein diacylglycerol transferase